MGRRRDSIPVSKHLPPDAAAELVKASQVRPTPEDPLARTKAIEKAVQKIRSENPKLFRKE